MGCTYANARARAETPLSVPQLRASGRLASDTSSVAFVLSQRFSAGNEPCGASDAQLRAEWLDSPLRAPGKGRGAAGRRAEFSARATWGCVLCWVAGRRWRAAWSTWRQDGGRTASPNAGQTTACAAGALSVRLENDGHYVLSGGSRLPDASAIADARQLITRALWMGAALAAVIRLTIGD